MMILVSIAPGEWAWNWPNAPKAVWGRLGWKWLHETAIDYPLDPTPQEAAAVALRLRSFAAHLPCGECRGHATAYLAKNPPALSNTYALQSWAWRFHNAVNKRLGKPVITYEMYCRIYARELENAAWKFGRRPAL